MNDIETLTERVDALETSRTYQDRTIEDLSKSVAAQWKLIETLNRQVAHLTEQLHEVRASASSGESQEPPPHY